MSETELAKVISSAVEENIKNKQTLVKPGEVNTWFQLNYYKIKCKVTNVLVEKKDDAGNRWVVGHSTLSQLPVVVGGGSATWAQHALDTSPSTIITETGRTQIAKWIANETPNQPNYCAWGTGTTAYTTSDTDLESESVRVILDSITKTDHGIGELIFEFSPSATVGNLTEVGWFDDSSGGNMWYRAIITPALTVSSTLAVRVTLTVEFTDRTDAPSSLITNYGLDHFRNFVTDDEAVFTSTKISDGETDPHEDDTNLDGDNSDKNAVSSRKRTNLLVEVATVWDTTEFNTYKMGKIGNFKT